jgi:GINS complex subunit 3
MTQSQFFDIDHILMEAEKVQAELLIDSYNCDKLEQGLLDLAPSFPSTLSRDNLAAQGQTSDTRVAPKEETEDYNPLDDMPELTSLPKGTKLKLPIWLAFGFLNQRFITVQLQDIFEDEYIRASISHPEGLNLKEKCQYYYEIGTLLSQRLSKPTISGYLGKIFLERLKEIFKILFNESDSTTSNNFLQKLSAAEESFYQHGKQAFDQFRIWHAGKDLEIRQYSTHINRKKMKNDRNN